MDFKELERTLMEQIGNLHGTPLQPREDTWEYHTLEGHEADLTMWRQMVSNALNTAKTFEIHCWIDEAEEIELALRYGERKDHTWIHGEIITGAVTQEFAEMVLSQPKPADSDMGRKLTPFFNLFLDDVFQSSHYGTELCVNAKE